MLKELFREQREILNHFFDTVSSEDAKKILQLLLDCRGVVICSGVGKSGFIAEKMASTLLSTGTRAFFLNPANALHGDIGFLTQEDILLCFSKSGQSKELLDLIPFVHKKGIKSIALVSQRNSKLAALCNFSLLLPVMREICPYDLTPTSSTLAQLAFADCIAVALMKSKKFGINDFANNHPAGLLGRKAQLTVSDVMLQGHDLPLCQPEAKLIDSLYMLSDKKCGCLLIVTEEGILQGIFTDGDLRRAIHTEGPEALQMSIAQLMTKNPKKVSPYVLILDALHIMEEDPHRLITVLPVVEENKVVGLIRLHDILQSEPL